MYVHSGVLLEELLAGLDPLVLEELDPPPLDVEEELDPPPNIPSSPSLPAFAFNATSEGASDWENRMTANAATATTPIKMAVFFI